MIATGVDDVFKVVRRVIQQASREKPADAMLRAELKAARVPREDSARAARLVFAYYRWKPLLAAGGVEEQIAAAQDLDEQFQRDASSVSEVDLRRVVPEWAREEVDLPAAFLQTLQQQPVMWLRARPGTAKALSSRLKNCRFGPLPDSVEYLGREDLYRAPEFQRGEFEIQDIASQAVSFLCGPAAGETWWDACAGEGGKMLHLSDLMENKGLIWATDRAEWRLKRLKQRAARARVFNYRAVQWDGGEKRPTKTMFDGVLVDAPCSGVGTWQRNPHARWTTTLNDVRELAEAQLRLLLHAAPAVKPGGKLIYSVCTLARSETDGVTDLCSRSLSGFEPLPMPALPNEQQGASARKWIWPQDLGGNGMFLAAWRRVS